MWTGGGAVSGADWNAVWQGLQDIWIPTLAIAAAAAAIVLISFLFQRRK